MVAVKHWFRALQAMNIETLKSQSNEFTEFKQLCLDSCDGIGARRREDGGLILCPAQADGTNLPLIPHMGTEIKHSSTNVGRAGHSGQRRPNRCEHKSWWPDAILSFSKSTIRTSRQQKND
jgi:hypothetical protein